MIIFASALLVLTLTSAPEPCTKEQAYATPGKWLKAPDDTAMADQTIPKGEYKTLIAKGDRIIDLLKKSIPDITGLDAKAYHNIRGGSYVKDGAMKFGVTSLFLSYYCVPATGYAPAYAGTIQPGGETGTWIYFSVNALDWLANERMMFTSFKSPKGNDIFYIPKVSSEKIRGFEVLLPDIHHGRRGEEAMLIVPEGRSPYKPLSREKFMMARIAYEKKDADKEKLKAALEAMSPEDRAAPSVIDHPYETDVSKIFGTEAKGARPVGTIDRSLFESQGDRQAIRMITIYWTWDQDVPTKVALIRQFKEHFDFEALQKMIGQ